LEKIPQNLLTASPQHPDYSANSGEDRSTATPGTFPLSPFITSAARSVKQRVPMVCYW